MFWLKVSLSGVMIFLLYGCVAPVNAPGGASVGSHSTGAFPSRPSLERLENGHYRVLNDWSLTVSGRSFIIPAGYTSNGITAPTSVKTLLGDGVNYAETWSAVFHDWCFTQPSLTRFQADNYFIQLMRDYQISERKIRLMETAVRSYTLYKETQ